jgi:aquaporin Z
MIGNQANLANAPNNAYPIQTIIGVEIIGSALLMSVIYVVVYTKGLKRFGGIVTGGMIGLDMFLAFISCASMNPARSLARTLVSEFYCDSSLIDNTLYGATIINVSLI